MGQLINSSLIILGTLVTVCGISFFIREKEMGSIRLHIMLLGIFAGLWCYGYGFMGMHTSPLVIAIPRAVGLFSIVGYLGIIVVLLMRLIGVPEKCARIVAAFYFAYGCSDAFMMSGLESHNFVQVDGRTAYYTINSFVTIYHKIYL